MDKYKISSPKLDDIRRRRRKLDIEEQVEHARLAKEKAAALCAEMRKRKEK